MIYTLLTSLRHNDGDISGWNSNIRDLYASSATVQTRILRNGAVDCETDGGYVESFLGHNDAGVNLESRGGIYNWDIILIQSQLWHGPPFGEKAL